MAITPRIAVIGVGAFGQLHLDVLRMLQRQGLARLVAFAARTRKSVDTHSGRLQIEGYTDWAQMLRRDDLDAVTIATPDHLHNEMTLAAIKSGRHALVEKPMVLDVEQGWTIVRKAREQGILVAVDYHKRYDPTLLAVKDILATGQLGKIQYGYMCLEERIGFVRDQIASWAQKTNPSWVVGIHCYDVLRWLLGQEVVSVQATAGKGKLVAAGLDMIDSVQANLHFQGGANITVHSGLILPDEFEGHVGQNLKLVGEDGIVHADLQYRGLRVAAQGLASATPNPQFMQRRPLADGTEELTGYGVASIVDFVRNVSSLMAGTTVADLKGYYPSAEDGLAGVRIAAAVDESFHSSKTIRIDNTV